MTNFLLIFLAFVIITDLLAFKGIYTLVNDWQNVYAKRLVLWGFWLVTMIFIGVLIYLLRNQPGSRSPQTYYRYYLYAGFLLLIYMPKIVFIVFNLTEDIVYGVIYAFNKIFSTHSPMQADEGEKISRLTFITQVGLIVSAIPFFSILYGMIWGRFNFKTTRTSITYKDLPEKFHGLSIVQISDIHVGSFTGHEGIVEETIEEINNLKPDLIFFTGDLVNNFAEELNGWVPLFKKLRAKHGIYSILGNHDYGDYHQWENKLEKEQNLEKIKNAHGQMGFKLLLNEHDIIEIEGDKIAIIGVENWGLPPFVQYGDYNKAAKGIENISFKILLSHDPSHWDAKILRKEPVNLTLSGHTHGMQFGIITENIKWSPVKYKYPRWAGLYTEGEQHLYVNRGFGYIGYPGRIGMPPEISMIKLLKET